MKVEKDTTMQKRFAELITALKNYKKSPDWTLDSINFERPSIKDREKTAETSREYGYIAYKPGPELTITLTLHNHE